MVDGGAAILGDWRRRRPHPGVPHKRCFTQRAPPLCWSPLSKSICADRPAAAARCDRLPFCLRSRSGAEDDTGAAVQAFFFFPRRQPFKATGRVHHGLRCSAWTDRGPEVLPADPATTYYFAGSWCAALLCRPPTLLGNRRHLQAEELNVKTRTMGPSVAPALILTHPRYHPDVQHGPRRHLRPRGDAALATCAGQGREDAAHLIPARVPPQHRCHWRPPAMPPPSASAAGQVAQSSGPASRQAPPPAARSATGPRSSARLGTAHAAARRTSCRSSRPQCHRQRRRAPSGSARASGCTCPTRRRTPSPAADSEWGRSR